MAFSLRGEVRTSIVPATGSMVKYSPDVDDAEDVPPDEDDVEEVEEEDEESEVLIIEATVCWT